MENYNESTGRVLNNIRHYLKINSDAELANFLGVKPSTVSSWRKRNSLDLKLIYKKCKNIDANWLLTGQGNMLRSTNSTASVEEIHVLRERILDLEHDVAEREKLLIQYKQWSDWANKHPWRALWNRITAPLFLMTTPELSVDLDKQPTVFRTRQQAEQDWKDILSQFSSQSSC